VRINCFVLSNKTTGKLSYDQQPEFRSLSEFYIIIFLNKLKIVENTRKKWKNLNKTSWPMRGEFRWYIGPGPGEQEGSRESLKGHIALAIDVLFRFFHFLRVFSTIFSLFRKIIM
jgi:hypothetical protein